MARNLAVLGAVLFCTLVACVSGAVVQLSPSDDDWQQKLTGTSIAAGTTFELAAGTYQATVRLGVSWQGTASSPIVMRAATAGTVTINRSATGTNLMDINGKYFQIDGIAFTGGSRGLVVGDGKSVAHATFSNLEISGTAATAFSCNYDGLDYDDIHIVNVSISDTGSDTSECFYLGCNENACQFHDSVVENVLCHNTLDARSGFGAGLQIKGGSYRNVVRNSVFYDLRGPGIVTYDDYDRGANVIEANLVWNAGDTGIQFSAGTYLYNNIVHSSVLAAFASSTAQLQTGKAARNLRLLHNTALFSTSDYCFRMNSWDVATGGKNSIVVANNAFFCTTSIGSAATPNPNAVTLRNNAIFGANVVTGTLPAGSLIDNVTSTPAAQLLVSSAPPNAYPKSSSSLLAAGTGDYNDWLDVDFNYNSRSSSAPTIGAYEYATATNPGWIPAAGSFNPTSSSRAAGPGGSGGGGDSNAAMHLSAAAATTAAAAVAVAVFSFV